LDEKTVLVLLEGEAENEAKALETAKRYRNCPYVRLMTTSRKQLFAAYAIPEEQRWWIEHIQSHPEDTLRLKNVSLIFPDHVTYPENLDIQPVSSLQTTAPCGSRCAGCRSYSKCLGCPATIWHKKAK